MDGPLRKKLHFGKKMGLLCIAGGTETRMVSILLYQSLNVNTIRSWYEKRKPTTLIFEIIVGVSELDIK